MKVVVVTPRFPYPMRDGLLIRMHNLLRQVSGKHEVTLASLASQPPTPAESEAVRGLVNDMVVFPRSRSVAREGINALLSLAGGRPFTIARYFSRELHGFLSEADEAGTFDVAHFHTIHMGQYAGLMRRTRTLLDTPDVVSEIWKLGRDTLRNPLMWVAVHTQYRAVLRYEPWVYRQADLVAAVSEQDRSEIARVVGEDRTRLVPNGVDTEIVRPLAEPVEPESMVFVGNMQWPPNADGADWFCREVLPLILKQHPKAKLYLVGHSPGAALQKLAGESVVVTGTVPDVRPYVARGAVSVVPLRVGGGTRLKILEAMALARPVVSTSLGCQGLSASDGENIAIADAPDAFARAVGSLFSSESERRRLGLAGREFVAANYDWKAIGAQLSSIYAELMLSRA